MAKRAIYTQMNRQYAGNLDARYSFANEEKLFEYLEKEETAYDGMPVYLEDTGKYYIINKVAPTYTEVESVEGEGGFEVESAEPEATFYLHEIVKDTDFNQHLLKSAIFTQLLSELNTLKSSTQEAVNNIQDEEENIAGKCAQDIYVLNLLINDFVEFMNEKTPGLGDEFKAFREEKYKEPETQEPAPEENSGGPEDEETRGFDNTDEPVLPEGEDEPEGEQSDESDAPEVEVNENNLVDGEI